MKRRWFAVLLAAVLLMTVVVPVYAMSLSKAELYDAAKTELEKYLNDEATMPLEDLFLRFSELGSYEMSIELAMYTDVLRSIENENYSLIYVFIGILRQDAEFIEYLEDVKVYGTLDILESYARGRQAEQSGDMVTACEYYNQCLNFMDSTERVRTQMVADLGGKYQEALNYYGMGTLEGYQKAYELFGELAKYNYASSAALMSTSKTLLDALQAQMKPASVCGVCGAEAECACADVLCELQMQIDNINSLLNSDQCTSLCLTHCADEKGLASFLKSWTAPADDPIVKESALADGQVCRICMMGDACECAGQYLQLKSQFELISGLLGSESCSGCCPPHCEKNQFVVITNSSANIRSGPGSDSQVIKTALFRDTFPYLGEVDNWYRIRAYGQVAYVVKTLSALTSEMNTMPVKPINAGSTSNSDSATDKPTDTAQPEATPCTHSSIKIVITERYDEGDDWAEKYEKRCSNCNKLMAIGNRVCVGGSVTGAEREFD